MGTLEPNMSQPSGAPEPELNLLLRNQTLDEPIWKSLFRNIDEFFFPKKLPPLVLTSKPVPVRDIWGFYNNKRKGAIGSTIVHVVALALIIVASLPWSYGMISDAKGRLALVFVDFAALSGGLGFLLLGRLHWAWLKHWWPTKHIHQLGRDRQLAVGNVADGGKALRDLIACH